MIIIMSSYDYRKQEQRLLNQEERRRKILLECQKKGRSDWLTKVRGLTECNDSRSDGDSVSIQDNTCNRYRKQYKPLLMLSEWLTAVPCDFEDYWTFVFCPEGKRNLLIAKNGKTKVYNRHGIFINSFRSMLPLGHPEDNSTSKSGAVILDVIWNKKTKTYYVLDVLQWKNQIFYECEREFRFSWLQSKFLELEDKLGGYIHNVILLPEYYILDIQDHVLNYPVFQNNVPGIDGILFFHKQGHYISGVTPVVTWLKTFMLPEILNISVAEEYFKEKPFNYSTLNDYLMNTKIWNKKKARKNGKMEVEDVYVACCELESAEMEEN